MKYQPFFPRAFILLWAVATGLAGCSDGESSSNAPSLPQALKETPALVVEFQALRKDQQDAIRRYQNEETQRLLTRVWSLTNKFAGDWVQAEPIFEAINRLSVPVTETASVALNDAQAEQAGFAIAGLGRLWLRSPGDGFMRERIAQAVTRLKNQPDEILRHSILCTLWTIRNYPEMQPLTSDVEAAYRKLMDNEFLHKMHLAWLDQMEREFKLPLHETNR